jgi:hypothetical protein
MNSVRIRSEPGHLPWSYIIDDIDNRLTQILCDQVAGRGLWWPGAPEIEHYDVVMRRECRDLGRSIEKR